MPLLLCLLNRSKLLSFLDGRSKLLDDKDIIFTNKKVNSKLRYRFAYIHCNPIFLTAVLLTFLPYFPHVKNFFKAFNYIYYL